jgi:hypothetical protein
MEAPALNASSECVGRPDTLFAFVAGLYVALLVSPALLVAVALWVTASEAVVYVGLLLTIPAIVAAASVGVRNRPGLPERLGGTGLTWGLSLVGGLAAVGYFTVAVSDALPPAAGGVGMAGFFCGMSAGVLGFFLVLMSRTRHAKALVDEATVEATWDARWPRRRRYLAYALAGLALAANLVTLAASVLTDWESGFGAFGIGIAAILLTLGQERTYRVTAAGLERRHPAVRRLFPWRSFARVRTTDEAVVVERRAWWRPSIRCDRGDIDDVDAVVAALSAHVGTEDGGSD